MGLGQVVASGTVPTTIYARWEIDQRIDQVAAILVPLLLILAAVASKRSSLHTLVPSIGDPSWERGKGCGGAAVSS
jgi:hypothetical protein